ncbi:DUF485 domain-containing protein [Streptomyces sp. NPDC047821]|uniref:DUF485 domain-containing protein n=1 Tax=unclassified Streptomyces TaxID=2593676 RepID=UPI00362F443A
MSHQHPFPDPPPYRHPDEVAGSFWDAPAPQHPEPREPRRPHGDLDALRSGYRRLRRVSTLTALGYFTLFLLLAAFAPGLMTSEISGGLNVGLLLGLGQLPVALAAIALYERIARHRLDPVAAAVREQHPWQAAAETRGPAARGARPGGQEQWPWASGRAGGGRS